MKGSYATSAEEDFHAGSQSLSASYYCRPGPASEISDDWAGQYRDTACSCGENFSKTLAAIVTFKDKSERCARFPWERAEAVAAASFRTRHLR